MLTAWSRVKSGCCDRLGLVVVCFLTADPITRGESPDLVRAHGAALQIFIQHLWQRQCVHSCPLQTVAGLFTGLHIQRE